MSRLIANFKIQDDNGPKMLNVIFDSLTWEVVTWTEVIGSEEQPEISTFWPREIALIHRFLEMMKDYRDNYPPKKQVKREPEEDEE